LVLCATLILLTILGSKNPYDTSLFCTRDKSSSTFILSDEFITNQDYYCTLKVKFISPHLIHKKQGFTTK